MESIAETYLHRHFDPTDSLAAKNNFAWKAAGTPYFHYSSMTTQTEVGNFAYELDEDGSFMVCKNGDAPYNVNVDIRSESSSMEGNVGTIPDIHSVVFEDDIAEYEAPTSLLSHGCPPMTSDKSHLVEYIGNWTDVEQQAILPWRLDPVQVEDLEVEPDYFATPYVKDSKDANRSEFMKPKISSQSHLPWSSRFNPRSVAGSSDSLPPLTEDSSRDTDSIAFSEPNLSRDEIPSLRTSFIVHHEANSLILSPLGSIPAGFGMQFDQFDDDSTAAVLAVVEEQSRERTPQRPPTLLESFLPIDECIDDDLGVLEEDDVSDLPEEDSIDSTDSESIWMSDYSEGVPILEEGHAFLVIKPTVLREALLSFQSWHQRPQGDSQNPSSTGTPAPSNGEKADKSSRGKRRCSAVSGRWGSREDEDDQGGPMKRLRTVAKISEHKVSFACPYAKKDPLRYRSCYAFVLNRIQDVKQHLSRCHQLPIYCPRCMSNFDTEFGRDEHVRASSCPLEEPIHYEGITRAQKTKLSQRVSSKNTPSENWFTIFDILFPGHNPKPRSAYANSELTEDLEAFQDLMCAEGPNIIATAIRSSGIQVVSMANEERELSALLQSAIEDGLQIIAQRWLANAIPDHGITNLALPDEATGSLASHSIEESQPSRASSDTLINPIHRIYTTEQSISIELGEHAENFDKQMVQMDRETLSAPENMVINGMQHSDRQGSHTLSLDMPSLEQEYHETISGLGLEDDGQLWRLTGGGNFFPPHDYENPVSFS